MRRRDDLVRGVAPPCQEQREPSASSRGGTIRGRRLGTGTSPTGGHHECGVVLRINDFSVGKVHNLEPTGGRGGRVLQASSVGRGETGEEQNEGQQEGRAKETVEITHVEAGAGIVRKWVQKGNEGVPSCGVSKMLC